MPSTTILYNSQTEGTAVTNDHGPVGEISKDAGVSMREGCRKRNVPLVEPIHTAFPLAPILPTILRDLNVDISTRGASIRLQYSIHTCPLRMKREMRLVFPEVREKENDLLIIPTFQRTRSSMVGYEIETQVEKDAKLHDFYRWGAELVSRLRRQGHWADITDPMSGMALFTASGPSLYPDVEGAEILLRYNQVNIGACFVLSHPQWGTNVYPGTAFTLAPIDVVKSILNDMQASEFS